MAYGQMVKQGDKLFFSPCRDRSYAFVEDVSADGSVLKILNSMGVESGKHLYVELLGVLEEHQYRGYITVARHDSTAPLDDVRQALTFLRNL